MKLKLSSKQVRHILLHLEANEIHKPVGRESDFYFGNKDKFVETHRETIKVLKEALDD